MIKHLSEYFLPEQEFYLQNISYNRIEKTVDEKEHSLNCVDSIKVDVDGKERVRVTVTRDLYFEQNELFDLAVTFGAILKFNPVKKDEYKWHEINMAEEFRENGEFVTNNLVARISLLIAQITSSFGQMPLVLQPSVTK